MKSVYVYLVAIVLVSYLYAGDKGLGEKCNSDVQCSFGSQCTDGVCTKKSEYDHGSSGKSGKQCNIDADCIGSGKCATGSFGRKHCTGR